MGPFGRLEDRLTNQAGVSLVVILTFAVPIDPGMAGQKEPGFIDRYKSKVVRIVCIDDAMLFVYLSFLSSVS